MSQDDAGENQKRRNFFISYTSRDRQWAEWIAFQLEAAGYTLFIQAWDFRPGSNFVAEMDRATKCAERTLLVLSPAYLESGYAFAEWATAFRFDPEGIYRRLLPVRIEPCDVSGLLGTVVYIDLVGLDKTQAKKNLLEGVQQGRAKPSTVAFPGQGKAHPLPVQSSKKPAHTLKSNPDSSVSPLADVMSKALSENHGSQPGTGSVASGKTSQIFIYRLFMSASIRKFLRGRNKRLLVAISIIVIVLALALSLTPFLSLSPCRLAFCRTTSQPTSQPPSNPGKANDSHLSAMVLRVDSPAFAFSGDPESYSSEDNLPTNIGAVLLAPKTTSSYTIVLAIQNLQHTGDDIVIDYVTLQLLHIPSIPRPLTVWTGGRATTDTTHPYPTTYDRQNPGQSLHAVSSSLSVTLAPDEPDQLDLQVSSDVSAYLQFKIAITYHIAGPSQTLNLAEIFHVIFSDASNWQEYTLQGGSLMRQP